MSAQALVAACHELAQRGWVANHDGNISLRQPGGRYLVTPTAFRKADVRAVDLLVVGEDGTVQQGRHRIFSEWQLHRQVYAVRRDASAVVHAHPPFASAMACAGQRLSPAFMAESIVSLGPELGWVPYADPGSKVLEQSLRDVASATNATLLAQHGVLAWGADLTMALARLELVEHLATIYVHALAMGGVKPLPAASVAAMSAKHVKAGLAAPEMKL